MGSGHCHGICGDYRWRGQHEADAFRLCRLVYYVDGKRVYVIKDDDGDLYKRKTCDVYFHSVTPGEHVLAVEARYRGHGYSLFRYLNSLSSMSVAPIAAPAFQCRIA